MASMPRSPIRRPYEPASMSQVVVPDIGDFKDVEVIEVLVKPGDAFSKEQSLITLESDKATMEIPSPAAGVVKALRVKTGDKVSQGTPILELDAEEKPKAGEKKAEPKPRTEASSDMTVPVPDIGDFKEVEVIEVLVRPGDAVAKEQSLITLESDKATMEIPAPAAARGGGALPFNLPPWPEVDFAKFGPVEVKPLSRIQKLSGPYLHRNWVSIPHITQFDESDITDLEAFRKAQTVETEKKGFKLTMLAFMIKACVTTLRQYPVFNSSLDKSGESIVIKKYFHIGVAVDTPGGLVVPVVRDADRKGVFDLAQELADISKLAREGKLKPGDMQGGTFSISSLGGIGGTAFTPIINAPEVAILGVSRGATRPVWNGKEFAPRLMLPLSLSYDHRVIDGATAARFSSYLVSVLSDIRKLILSMS